MNSLLVKSNLSSLIDHFLDFREIYFPLIFSWPVETMHLFHEDNQELISIRLEFCVDSESNFLRYTSYIIVRANLAFSIRN